MPDRKVLAFGALFFVDLVLSVVMLVTDKNLQTDFGAQSPYYAHWWGVLAMAAIDLAVAAALVMSTTPAMENRMSPALRRAGTVASLVWAIVAIAVMVGISTAYSQVGFKSMSQFDQYLFGVTAYPGALSYIPWLYDALLAAYVVTAIVGVVAVLSVRARYRTEPTG
jgi:cytochrome bd-type quinol oxidase subunit 2